LLPPTSCGSWQRWRRIGCSHRKSTVFNRMSMRKDYVAQSYGVREEQGVSDRINCFLQQPARHLTDWQHYRHRDTDGIGMLTMVRTELGYTDQPLPLSRDRSEPGFWQTWRRRRQLPRETAAKTVHWRPPHNAAGNNR